MFPNPVDSCTLYVLHVVYGGPAYERSHKGAYTKADLQQYSELIGEDEFNWKFYMC